jgi:hypothetical protein
MASSRSWPFDDDDDRPSGSVRPLSQADLQAILAHLNSDPEQLLAGTGADQRVVVAAGWGLRFRPSPDAVAWRRGAAGERRTARLLGPLEPHGGRSCTTWPSRAAEPTSIIW